MDDIKIRVIDSKKLIEAINTGSYEINLSAVMALGAVVTQSASQWIPCSERLPEKSGEYLVTVKWLKGKFITFVEYDADYKEWFDEKTCCWMVTAWRPKPIPWEG